MDCPLLIDAPAPLSDSIPGVARVSVRGRVAGVSFTGAVVPLGGKRRLVVPDELARSAGLYDGARVTLEIEAV